MSEIRWQMDWRLEKHRRQLRYKVTGFWSPDYVRVEQWTDLDGSWREPYVSWSCGGRDDEESGDLAAAENLGHAIVDACQRCRNWREEIARQEATP